MASVTKRIRRNISFAETGVRTAEQRGAWKVDKRTEFDKANRRGKA